MSEPVDPANVELLRGIIELRERILDHLSRTGATGPYAAQLAEVAEILSVRPGEVPDEIMRALRSGSAKEPAK